MGVPMLKTNVKSDLTKIEKSCKGHGKKDICFTCGFGICLGCDKFMSGPQAYWGGNCGCYVEKTEDRAKHERRVLSLIDRNELPAVASKKSGASQSRGGSKKRDAEPASSSGRVKRVAVRIEDDVAAAPRKSRNVAPAILPIAQAVPVDASINLNLAPGITVGEIRSNATQTGEGSWRIDISVDVSVGLQGN